MEKIINKSLILHLTQHSLIDNNQHGFIQARSTLTNILKWIQQWTDTIQNKQNMDTIYLDFRKASDSISRVKLMNKLSAYGLDNNWF